MPAAIPYQNKTVQAQKPQGMGPAQAAMPLRAQRGTGMDPTQLTPEQKIQQMLAMGQITAEQATQMLANMRMQQMGGAMPVRNPRGKPAVAGV